MKKNYRMGALLCAFFVVRNASVLAQGSLTPPGAPAPTMKSLAQIEARTPISSAPYTITQPGAYYLTQNLTVSSGNAIVIEGLTGVTLDLNGFTISSTASPVAGQAIFLHNTCSCIIIRNGHIAGGVTYSGGTYSGTGFRNGISALTGTPINVHVTSVTVLGLLNDGINLGYVNSSVVESCAISTVGGNGIIATNAIHSSATTCGMDGISANSVADCVGIATGGGRGVNADTVINSEGQSGSGSGVQANWTAANCYGTSTSGAGVDATSASNCYGISGSAWGVRASVANNCYGYSSSYYGVDVLDAASNCYGESGSYYGLFTDSATNCVGRTANATNRYALVATIAIGCHAINSTSTGLGLFATIGNSSYGENGSGISENVANKYNMP